MSKATIKLRSIFKRIEDTLNEVVRPDRMVPIAEFVMDLVIKRTRLGYGVKENFGTKYKFPSLSQPYIKFRRGYRRLADSTSPSKSNITLTGQLLESVQITKKSKGSISFGPSGVRRERGLKNAELALILEQKNRTFLKISKLEFDQTIRFYRKSFGDLLNKKRLLG